MSVAHPSSYAISAERALTTTIGRVRGRLGRARAISQIQNRGRSTLARQETRAGYLFLLPNLIGFLVLTVVPVGSSLVLSAFDFDFLSPATFVGLANFQKLVLDPLFRQVLGNTLSFTLGVVPLNLVIALGLALWLNHQLRGKVIFRSAFFMPVVTITVAVAQIWRWMYQPDAGLFNAILHLVGLPGPVWLGDPRWALPSLIVMSVWKNFGYNMVIFLAGLQGIPETLYEAAAIDGVNPWTRFRYITLPLLSPTTFFVVIMTVIGSFQVFDQAVVMTAGGPADNTNTIVLYLYQQGFQQFHMGYAAAIAWVLFAILFAVTLLQMRLQRTWVHYS